MDRIDFSVRRFNANVLIYLDRFREGKAIGQWEVELTVAETRALIAQLETAINSGFGRDMNQIRPKETGGML